MADQKIAIIRVRGQPLLRHDIVNTLNALKIYRKNYCTLVPATDSYLGMIFKVKDFVTYGFIDAETEKLLMQKKAEKSKDGIKPFFRLNPPKKGYGRKGTKVAFCKGGALGDRGAKINDLIRRMI